MDTAYFQGKTQQFVREWLERNNLSQEHMIASCLSKLKSVLAGMF